MAGRVLVALERLVVSQMTEFVWPCDAELKASPPLADGPASRRTSMDVRRRSIEGIPSVKGGDRQAETSDLPPASPRHPGRAAGALASAQVS